MNIDEFVRWLNSASAAVASADDTDNLTPEQQRELLVRAELYDVARRALLELDRITNPKQPLSGVEFPMGTGPREWKIRELLAHIPPVIRAAERGDVWEAVFHAVLVGARYDFDLKAGDAVDLRRAFESDRPMAEMGRNVRRGQVHRGKKRRKIMTDAAADEVLLTTLEQERAKHPEMNVHELHAHIGKHYNPPVSGRTIRHRLTEIRRRNPPE